VRPLHPGSSADADGVRIGHSDDARDGKRCSAHCPVLLLAFAAMIALVLVNVHAVACDYADVWIVDVSIVVLFFGYVVLRFLRILDSGSLAPFAIFMTLLLSLLLIFSAPGRRHFILGSEETPMDAECEEGNSALTLGLLLALVATVLPIPTWHFIALVQFVCTQYFVFGILLPRPECDARFVPRVSPGGVLFGWEPIWIESFQLWLLGIALCAQKRMCNHCTSLDELANIAMKSDADLVVTDSSNATVVPNQFERVFWQMEREANRWRSFLHEVDEQMPEHSDNVWCTIVNAWVAKLGEFKGELQKNARRNEDYSQFIRSKVRSRTGSSAKSQVSGWLEQVYTTGDQDFVSDEKSDVEAVKRQGSHDSFRRVERVCTSITSQKELRTGHWDLNAHRIENSHGRTLQIVGYELLRSVGILNRSHLVPFLELLENSYVQTNRYHSHVHAADMCNSVFFLTTKSGLWSGGLSVTGLSDASRAALLLAALGHDVGHFARTNAFLAATRHEYAIAYNDRSILENFHAATLIRLIQDTSAPVSRAHPILSEFSPEQAYKARQLMISLILSTDTTKHFDELATFRLHINAESFDPFADSVDQQLTLGMLFRAADIGHSAKEWTQHVEWSERIVQEFHAQGDEEKRLGIKVSPLCDRDDFDFRSSQAAFLQFICLPTWRALATFEECMLWRLYEPSVRSEPSDFWRRVPSDASRHHSSSPSLSLSSCGTTPRNGSNDACNLRWMSHRRTVLQNLSLASPLPFWGPAMAVQEVYSPPPNTTKWLADVVLANCERNYEEWSAQSDPKAPSDIPTTLSDASVEVSLPHAAREARDD